MVKILLSELRSVVDHRFAWIDLGDRVFQVSKRIGSGTYGIVYDGTLDPKQTKVAVKVVRYDEEDVLPVLVVSCLFVIPVAAMSHDVGSEST